MLNFGLLDMSSIIHRRDFTFIFHRDLDASLAAAPNKEELTGEMIRLCIQYVGKNNDDFRMFPA